MALQVIDLSGRDAVQVGLHDYREQRLIHATAAFEQRGIERAGAQFRDAQLQVPGCGRERAGAVAVAQVGAMLGAFVQGGADGVGELGLDQGLVDGFGGLADTIADIGGLPRLRLTPCL
jgi:hypothetical protein